ncbi:MAG: murein L,D-transpeptidase catalytic domain-containing protein, partial [Flavisolibacter sp.]
MRKQYLPLTILCICFILTPVLKAGSSATYITSIVEPASNNASTEFSSNLLYDSLKLNRIGLSREAMLYAYKGQQKLARKGMLENADVLTVCDFSQPSNSKRMYIIDVRKFKLLVNTYVAHGKNSGAKYARKFSNRPESLQSSLGFYIT